VLLVCADVSYWGDELLSSGEIRHMIWNIDLIFSFTFVYCSIDTRGAEEQDVAPI
jgi:hypothetical protein